MHITGGDYEFIIFFTERNNLSVYLHKVIFILYLRIFVAVPYHKCVVSKWLYLKIIIELDKSVYFFLRLFFKYCTIKLTRFTG